MTTEQELAAYVTHLETRVERLKTIEDPVPVATGVPWVYLDTEILTVAGASLTFTNIPQTYTDLMVIWRARSADLGVPNREEMRAQFNGDTTAANYDTGRTFGNGGQTCHKDSGSVIVGDILQAGATGDANDFSHGTWYIPSYTNTTWELTTLGIQGSYGHTAVFGYSGQFDGAWRTKNAVTSIKFFSVTASNLLAKTIFDLYGLTR